MVNDHCRHIPYMHHPTDRMTHTTTFATPSRGALAGTKTVFVATRARNDFNQPGRNRRVAASVFTCQYPLNVQAFTVSLGAGVWGGGGGGGGEGRAGAIVFWKTVEKHE